MDLYVREATGDYRVARPREVLDSARDCVGQVFGKGRHICIAIGIALGSRLCSPILLADFFLP